LLLGSRIGNDARRLLGGGLDRLVCPLAAGGKAKAEAYGKADQRPKGEGHEVHLHPPIRPWAVGRVECSSGRPVVARKARPRLTRSLLRRPLPAPGSASTWPRATARLAALCQRPSRCSASPRWR